MSTSYGELMRRALNEHVLMGVLFELTYRCNLDCFFCYNDLGLQGRTLATEDYLRVLDDLAAMQALEITLSGGEPLASPSFWPVASRARELGFVVRIKSNGHALRGNVARRIRDEIEPYVVEISLHGARAETHDRQTRVVGSFERLMSNLEEMGQLGLRIKLKSTLTRWNEAEVQAMFALADGRGLQIEFDATVTPRDDGDLGPLDVSASDAGLLRFFELVTERRGGGSGAGPTKARVKRDCAETQPGAPAAGAKNCGTGSTTLTIDPFGNVYPCVQWRRSVGNLHERSVREIWTGSDDLDEIRRLNVAAAGLKKDRGLGSLPVGFCLGLAEELTGDPLAMYPSLERQARLFGQADSPKNFLPVLDG